MTLKLTFLGGASSIGASCALLETAQNCFLIDCGVRFNPDAPLPHLDGLVGKNIDAIFVTHAHSDHTGGLPLAHAVAPTAPVYMTPPTVDLIRVLYRDALHIMGSSERETELPLYQKQDVESLFTAIRPVGWHEVTTVGDTEIRYLPASHILGASMIHFSTPSGNVLFTGDFSVTAQHTVDGLSIPDLPVDILVTESTYGNRMHSDRKVTEQLFVQRINEILERQGKVLIPSFALGRAQEIILILKNALRAREIPEVPIFVDGMVRHMCNVYSNHPTYLHPRLAWASQNESNIFFSDLIQPLGYAKDARQKVVDGGPCVIVASSGMLTGGPSTFYASKLAPLSENAILLSGYQDEESPGRALINLLNQPKEKEKFLSLPQGRIALKCEIGSYSLSAHADAQQILRLIEKVSPKTVILVHGDEDAKMALSKKASSRDVLLGSEGVCIERKYSARKIAAGSIRVSELSGPQCFQKGGEKKLQTFCEENLLPHPRVFCTENSDSSHTCKINLTLFRQPFEVSCTDKSLEEAKDKAALALFSKLRDEEVVEKIISPRRVRLLATDEENLKQSNHKGQLLELFQSLRQGEMPTLKCYGYGPSHERMIAGQGFLMWQDDLLESKLYVYRKEKTIEAAVCQEFLEQIKMSGSQRNRVAIEYRDVSIESTQAPSGVEKLLGQNSRMWLNEMRSKKNIKDFVYSLVEKSGPSHNPLFVMKGILFKNDGTTLEAGPFQAPSKKEAETLCADALADKFFKELMT